MTARLQSGWIALFKVHVNGGITTRSQYFGEYEPDKYSMQHTLQLYSRILFFFDSQCFRKIYRIIWIACILALAIETVIWWDFSKRLSPSISWVIRFKKPHLIRWLKVPLYCPLTMEFGHLSRPIIQCIPLVGFGFMHDTTHLMVK